MRSMLDAAWPPLGAPVGHLDIVAFYIGGGTPHVWTPGELDKMLAQTGAKGRLPIFVRVPPTTRDPSVEGAWCVQWAKDHGQPLGTCIALDYEMAVDNAYWTRFDDAVTAGGYRTLLYGTLSRVVLNVTSSGRRPSAGYWSAHWTNTPHICPNPGVTATQYGGDSTLNKPWDLSLVGDGVPIWGYEQGVDMSAAGPEKWDAADVGRFRELLSSWFAGGTLASHNASNVLDLPTTWVQQQPFVQGVAQAVKTAGITVTVDLSQASPEQLDALASGIAAHLVVKGQAYDLQGTLTPTPPA